MLRANSAAQVGEGGASGGGGREKLSMPGMAVADAETGELVVLRNKTAFEEEDDAEVEDVGAEIGGGTMHRRQTAAARAERGLEPVSYKLTSLVGVPDDKAAELQVYRARLEAELVGAIEREAGREEKRKQLLREEKVDWKRAKLVDAFRKERAQARREIEQLRYDNELSLAHKLASLGLLK